MKATLILTVVSCVAPLFSASANELNVAVFGGAVSDVIKNVYWEPFTQKTGAKIVSDVNDDRIGTYRALSESVPSKWDVAETDSNIAAQACAEGLLLPLDKSRFPEADLIAGSLDECGFVLDFVGTVMVYNKQKLGDNGPKTWSDYWDTKRFPQKRVMSKYITNLAPIALLAEGVPANQVNAELRKPGAKERVLKKIAELKNNTTFVYSATELVQALVSGAYDIGYGWNARINLANAERGGIFEMVWTAGYDVGKNSLVIPKNSGNAELAQQYIALVADPRLQANFMTQVDYGTSNKKAYDLLPAEVRERMPSDPSRAAYAIVEEPDFWSSRQDDWQSALEAVLASK